MSESTTPQDQYRYALLLLDAVQGTGVAFGLEWRTPYPLNLLRGLSESSTCRELDVDKGSDPEPDSEKMKMKTKMTMAFRLLKGFLKEAEARFPKSTLIETFWETIQNCDDVLKHNVITLLAMSPPIADAQIAQHLFLHVDPNTISWIPVLKLADQLLTQLGVPIISNRGSARRKDVETESVGGKTTQVLLTELENPSLKQERKEDILRVLALRRDGAVCVVTKNPLRAGKEFAESEKRNRMKGTVGKNSEERKSKNYRYFHLAHIIPHSGVTKFNFLAGIEMFAGSEISAGIAGKIDRPCNVLKIELQAHSAFHDLQWTIEAVETDQGHKYIYRTLRDYVGSVDLIDGEEIHFGRGEDNSLSGHTPDPEMCNIRLAIICVLEMSGAAHLLSSLKEEADDLDENQHMLKPDDFSADALCVKLQLVGGSILMH